MWVIACPQQHWTNPTALCYWKNVFQLPPSLSNQNNKLFQVITSLKKKKEEEDKGEEVWRDLCEGYSDWMDHVLQSTPLHTQRFSKKHIFPRETRQGIKETEWSNAASRQLKINNDFSSKIFFLMLRGPKQMIWGIAEMLRSQVVKEHSQALQHTWLSVCLYKDPQSCGPSVHLILSLNLSNSPVCRPPLKPPLELQPSELLIGQTQAHRQERQVFLVKVQQD